MLNKFLSALTPLEQAALRAGVIEQNVALACRLLDTLRAAGIEVEPEHLNSVGRVLSWVRSAHPSYSLAVLLAQQYEAWDSRSVAGRRFRFLLCALHDGDRERLLIQALKLVSGCANADEIARLAAGPTPEEVLRGLASDFYEEAERRRVARR